MACRRITRLQPLSTVRQACRSSNTALRSAPVVAHGSLSRCYSRFEGGDGGSHGGKGPKLLAAAAAAAPIALIVGLNEKSEDGDKQQQQEESPPLTPKQRTALFKQADELHERCEYVTEYELLVPYHAREDCQLLWRLSRATIMCRSPRKLDDHHKKATLQAFQLAKRGVELSSTHAQCLLWYGISLNHFQVYRSSQQKLGDVGKMYTAFMKSVLIDPHNEYTWYSLGSWHYHVAETSWFVWKAVEIANPGLVKGTYEEALNCFEKAEKVKPGFYLGNLQYLANTYEKLGNMEKCEEVLQRMVAAKVTGDVDAEYVEIAAERLKKLSAKKAKQS